LHISDDSRARKKKHAIRCAVIALVIAFIAFALWIAVRCVMARMKRNAAASAAQSPPATATPPRDSILVSDQSCNTTAIRPSTPTTAPRRSTTATPSSKLESYELDHLIPSTPATLPTPDSTLEPSQMPILESDERSRQPEGEVADDHRPMTGA
jgi:hypothetical protein